MSVLAVGDLIFKNLLSELNLYPNWEKWRGYFFAASVACSLFPLYMTLGGVPLNCVPVPGRNHSINEGLTSLNNVTEKNKQGKLSSSETAYINSLCAADGNIDENIFLVRYCGCFLLLWNVATLVVSTAWLHFSGVMDSLRSFAEARDILQKLVLTRDEVKTFSDEAINYSEGANEPTTDPKHIGIREASVLLVLHCNKKSGLERFPLSIACAYVLRSFFVSLTLLGAGIFSIHVATSIGSVGESFQCEAAIPTNSLGDTGNLQGDFSCVVNVARTMYGFVIAFTVAIGLQLLMIAYGWVVTCRKTSQLQGPHRSVAFMVALWKSSCPSQSEILNDIVKILFSKDYRESLGRKFNKIFEAKDYKLLSMLKTLRGGHIPEGMKYLHEKFDEDFGERGEPNVHHTEYKELLKILKYSILEESVLKFIEKLCNNRLMELLVFVLENSDLKDKLDPKLENDLKNKLAQMGIIITNENNRFNPRHSILYYALHPDSSMGPVQFAAARFLLNVWKKENHQIIIDNQDSERRSTDVSNYLTETYTGELATEILDELSKINPALKAPEPGSETGQSNSNLRKFLSRLRRLRFNLSNPPQTGTSPLGSTSNASRAEPNEAGPPAKHDHVSETSRSNSNHSTPCPPSTSSIDPHRAPLPDNPSDETRVATPATTPLLPEKSTETTKV